MMILGFPSNPTAQCVELDFFERVVALAKQYNVLVIHDLAYADIVYDGWKAPSIMQVPGAKDIAVEFFTLSKSYNMAGWRIGFMVGNPELVSAGAHQELSRLRHLYAAAGGGHRRAGRRSAVRARYRRAVSAAPQRVGEGAARGRLDGGKSEGVDVRVGENSRALCPPRFVEFAKRLLAEAKVCVSPGIGFGDYGDTTCASR